MILGEIPIWGQYGILGISIGFNIFIAVEWVRGNIVSRKQLEAVQKMADTWQKGWETSQANETRLGATVSKLSGLADVFSHFIDSLPKPGDKS